ncbi:hypothetical protein EYF80_009805 [Liparis tanakae]|uniref:Uncharacterized protein n=1 Tax=Liparis tanakae TaxID=230148 RepID=A0A4Z2IQC2_9TELE|nr:hypothetical protein EYF80_009805 [Liparis tanakae]
MTSLVEPNLGVTQQNASQLVQLRTRHVGLETTEGKKAEGEKGITLISKSEDFLPAALSLSGFWDWSLDLKEP